MESKQGRVVSTPPCARATAAIAAIGMKIQLKDMASVGLKPIVMMIGEIVFLMLLVIAFLAVIPQM